MYVAIVMFKFLCSLYFQSYRTLRIYGPSDKRGELEPALIWATPGQRGFNAGRSSRTPAGRSLTVSGPLSMSMPGPSQIGNPAQRTEAIRKQQEALQKAAELRQMLNALEKVDDGGRRASLLDTLCSKDDILAMPLHPTPPGIATGELVVDLLKHQVCNLIWFHLCILQVP